MRVLLVEPWMSGSHAQWASGFAGTSRHDVSIVSMGAGPWRWRLRTGAAPLSDLVIAHIEEHGAPDVVLLSGLVDGAQLMGLLRRWLSGSVPLVVYQHESQLVYPTAKGAVDNEAVLRNWSTWLAADLVLFNSDFHRRRIEAELPLFLSRQPSQDQLVFLEAVMDRFDVVPVGLDVDVFETAKAASSIVPNTPIIVWPHRWEADKDPAAFVRALQKLDDQNQDFGLVLAGADPAGAVVAEGSAERQTILERWGDRVVATGPFSRPEYLSWLAKADVVVSCARHEFFGVGVAEAMALGCVPVLPRALAYPELVPEQFHSSSLYEQGQFGGQLLRTLRSLDQIRTATVGLDESMDRFGWDVVSPLLDAHLGDVVNASSVAKPASG